MPKRKLPATGPLSAAKVGDDVIVSWDHHTSRPQERPTRIKKVTKKQVVALGHVFDMAGCAKHGYRLRLPDQKELAALKAKAKALRDKEEKARNAQAELEATPGWQAAKILAGLESVGGANSILKTYGAAACIAAVEALEKGTT